jgi:EAL domain-containing protein (putative c-di-GMP-specific phosphodiesterase class I)
VEILLDDFGSGGGSLGYLHTLPLAGVKFDQSIVGGLPHDSRAAALVNGVIRIATSFGLASVACAVEKPDHVMALSRMGCGHAQGPSFSAPISIDNVGDFLLGRVPEGARS